MNPLGLAFGLCVVGVGICLLAWFEGSWIRLQATAVRWVGRVFSVERVRRDLIQAGMAWLPAGGWVGVRVGSAGIVALVAYLSFGLPVLAAVGFLAVHHLLGLALEVRRRRHRLEWQQTLLDAVRYGSAVMGRGGNASEVLTALARSGPTDARPIFAELAGAASGAGVETSSVALVSEVRDRLAEPLFDDIALALILHWKRGARLVPALDAIVQEWEENIRLQREAKAMRSGVEASVIILALLPIAFLGILQFLAPALLEPFHTAIGQVLLGVAALWMVVGYRILQRMSAPPREDRLSLKEAAG